MLQVVAQHHQVMDFAQRGVVRFPVEHLIEVIRTGDGVRPCRATVGAGGRYVRLWYIHHKTLSTLKLQTTFTRNREKEQDFIMGVLEGKICLVTGGASGIGRATAIAMANEGAKVIVSYVNVAGGEETVDQIVGMGAGAIFVRCDVSNAVQVEALIAAAVSAYGRLDCAFNNAGIGGEMSPIIDKTEDEWDLVMNINLKGVWLCMKYEIPVMLQQGGGAIVNMASVAGLLGFRYAAAYSASKHGVIGLTKSAALETARKHIRVNAVCPYFTDTPMVEAMIAASPVMERATVEGTPMKRLASAEEIAQAVVWLCSDRASYITGHALPIDGGMVVN